MYCKNCGQQIDEKNIYCPYCGSKTALETTTVVTDAPSAGFAVLGFLFPLIGLILYLVYESKQPERAKSAGKGALIGFIAGVVISVVCSILAITGSIAVFANLSDYILDISTSVY